MPKVICTLPNASEEISGVKFISHKDGMVSEEISADQAAAFLSITGYVAHGAAPAETPPAPKAAGKSKKHADAPVPEGDKPAEGDQTETPPAP